MVDEEHQGTAKDVAGFVGSLAGQFAGEYVARNGCAIM